MQGTPLPDRVEAPSGLVLRRWTAADAGGLNRAIAQSIEHLRPWMAWIRQEPVPLSSRIAMMELWEHEWRLGGDALLGVFLNDRIVGGCGLHRRLGPGGLELGYWIHAGFLRRGFATAVARALTGSAFGVPGIEFAEIHHDKANVASSGVPRKLGFELLGEFEDHAEAPAELGIECRWRIEKRNWPAGTTESS
jgi:RimJ/RimL family protein N-acetyltransferase